MTFRGRTYYILRVQAFVSQLQFRETVCEIELLPRKLDAKFYLKFKERKSCIDLSRNKDIKM